MCPRPANLRLETKGRKSGLPHVVQLRYVRIGDSFFVLGSGPRSDWSLNALTTGRCRVRLGDYIADATAREAGASERERTLAAFEEKYGRQTVRRWYSSPQSCVCLSPTGPFVRRGFASGELEARTDYAHWASAGRNYYSEVAGAFDSASEEYDFTIRHNFINTWIRRRSIDILLDYVRKDDTLLEVGCGTGAEAIEISRYAKRLIATDISRRMIDLLTAKVAARRLGSKIIPVRLEASNVSNVRAFLTNQSIRVAYSFNGALNCEPRLQTFAEGLAEVLEPGGYFICSIRNTICLGEMLSHAFLFQFERATPRKKQPTMVSVGGEDVPATYYPPDRFSRFFEPQFKVVRMYGLPTLFPPAYLSDYYVRIRGMIPLIERLEPLAAPRFPFNRLGDQTLLVLQKVKA